MPSSSSVSFISETSASVGKPSRPKPKIPPLRIHGPLTLAFYIPKKLVLERLLEKDSKFQKIIDEHDIFKQQSAIRLFMATLCDQACELWPNTFIVLVDIPPMPCSFALGLADNTHSEFMKLPTVQKIQEMRQKLGLEHKAYRLGWWVDSYPDEHE